MGVYRKNRPAFLSFSWGVGRKKKSSTVSISCLNGRRPFFAFIKQLHIKKTDVAKKPPDFAIEIPPKKRRSSFSSLLRFGRSPPRSRRTSRHDDTQHEEMGEWWDESADVVQSVVQVGGAESVIFLLEGVF